MPSSSAAPPGILQRSIPRSGEQLPAIGLGTWQTFDVGDRANERTPLKEVLSQFVELGGRVIDSSPMYGKSESVAGDLAAELGVREKLFIATKVWTSGREAGIEQMTASMQRLRAQPIDLMQVHNLVDVETHLETLRRWKKAGRIRYLGVTHYRVDAFDELAALIQSEALDFVQLNYSIMTPAAEERLLPIAAANKTAVLVNRPFDGAAWFARTRGKPLPSWVGDFDCVSWAQFALKYILSNPAVTCAIPATSKPGHLMDNMRAGYGRLPDADTRQRMRAYASKL
ncbi:MAG: aldo/keto reductase [Burkholderiales bacterium]|nr:aldo/keto reductase [Burkholderiales bacterium]